MKSWGTKKMGNTVSIFIINIDYNEHQKTMYVLNVTVNKNKTIRLRTH